MTTTASLKDQIRKAAAARRRALDAAWRREASERIAALAAAQPWFAAAREVSLYVSARDEVDTRPLIAAALVMKGGFHAPRVEGAGGCLGLYHARDFPAGFVPGAFGLLEPAPEVWLKSEVEEMDVIFAPGLAFDRAGRRIGYGKGCYDRLFLGERAGGKRALRVGLAFSTQLFDALPEESHDARLDFIITEDEVIRISEE